MKRCLLMTAVLALVLLLAGCACQHEWSQGSCTEAPRCRLCGARGEEAPGHSFRDAGCETAKTCTACGLTEGDPLGHDWQQATCARPEHCSRCDQTKGEALEHNWVEATCAQPKHCSVCGVTQGSAVGHSWLDATCTTAKTCSICAITEGEPLGHSWTKANCTKPQSCLLCGLWATPALGHSWLDATCTEPVRCEFCDATQGEPLGHDWQEATFETPKTCRGCGLEEGLPIERDDRFIPEDCQILFGSWQFTQITTAEDLNVPGFDRDLEETIICTFDPYGGLTVLTKVVDPECYKAYLVADAVAYIYAIFAREGMDAEAADAYFLSEYGKTIVEHQQELVDATVTENEMNQLDTYVYFVTEEELCISMHWEDFFDGYAFSVEEDQLIVTNAVTGEPLVMQRVIETE